jgi:xanthine phosphoribosyltransferase
MNKLTISQSDLKKLVSDLCRQITLSKWRPDYIVGITRGGLIPAVMISQYFDIPMYALQVSLRDNGKNNDSNIWMAEDAFGLAPLGQPDETFQNFGSVFTKNILMVDDINDTGATINWIMDDWISNCLPKDPHWNDVWNNNVKFLTIVDNLSSKSRVKIDYSAIEINKADNDVWVDFPYEQWWKI